MDPKNPYAAPRPTDEFADSTPPLALSFAHLRPRQTTIAALAWSHLVVALSLVSLDYERAPLAVAVAAFVLIMLMGGLERLSPWARGLQIAVCLIVLVAVLIAMGRILEQRISSGLFPGLFCLLTQVGILYLFLSMPGREIFSGPFRATAGRATVPGHHGVILFKAIILTAVEFLALLDFRAAIELAT